MVVVAVRCLVCFLARAAPCCGNRESICREGLWLVVVPVKVRAKPIGKSTSLMERVMAVFGGSVAATRSQGAKPVMLTLARVRIVL